MSIPHNRVQIEPRKGARHHPKSWLFNFVAVRYLKNVPVFRNIQKLVDAAKTSNQRVECKYQSALNQCNTRNCVFTNNGPKSKTTQVARPQRFFSKTVRRCSCQQIKSSRYTSDNKKMSCSQYSSIIIYTYIMKGTPKKERDRSA